VIIIPEEAVRAGRPALSASVETTKIRFLTPKFDPSGSGCLETANAQEAITAVGELGGGVGSSGWFASSAGFIDHRRGTFPKAHEHLRVKRPVMASNSPYFDWRGYRQQIDHNLRDV
jgi:hypothetical protein